MCFSATVSFTTSALLLLSGGYGISKALKNDKRYLLLACIPLFFAIQQAFEGMVWLNNNNNFWTMAYLFFAFFTWPTYIPMSIRAIEHQPKRKKILMSLVIIGIIIGLSLYLPVIFQFTQVIIFPMRHSICYSLDLPYSKIYPISIFYLLVTVIACFVSSHHILRVLAILIVASFIVSFLFFKYAFTSVWCFMAALISLFLIYIIPKQKNKTSAIFK